MLGPARFLLSIVRSCLQHLEGANTLQAPVNAAWSRNRLKLLPSLAQGFPVAQHCEMSALLADVLETTLNYVADLLFPACRMAA